MTDIFLVYCTFPSTGAATLIAEDLVSSGLAACVSLSQPQLSIYHWEGKLCQEEEVLATIKTTKATLDVLFARVLELHSYDCPELIAVPVAHGSQPYLRWVEEQVQLP